MSVAENVAYGLRQTEDPEVRAAPSGSREALDMVRMRSSPTAYRPSCPAASSSASRSRGRWSTGPPCCCSTSRSARSTGKLREEMQVELKLLQHQLGITFVFVTHDQERGADDERPDRGHARRSDRAARRRRHDLRSSPPRHMSPASSASRTSSSGTARESGVVDSELGAMHATRETHHAVAGDTVRGRCAPGVRRHRRQHPRWDDRELRERHRRRRRPSGRDSPVPRRCRS